MENYTADGGSANTTDGDPFARGETHDFSPGDEWPEPIELKNELKAVSPFDPSLLPEPLRSFATDIAYRMQCPVDFVGAASLVMLSSLLGSRCAVRPKKLDDWSVVPNLWGAAVGEPGTLKSPAIDEVFSSLRRLERNAQQDHQEALARYKAEKSNYDSQEKALKAAMEAHAKEDVGVKRRGSNQEPRPTLDEVKRRLAALSEPKLPTCHRHLTSDPTTPKLAEICAENPAGVCLLRDELAGWLATFEQQGHESDRAFYLEAWSGGGSFTQDRIGRGTVIVPSLTVSVFGTIQPRKLFPVLYESVHGANDGFVQRFQITVYPDELPAYEYVDQKPDEDVRERVTQLVKRLPNLDYETIGASMDLKSGRPYFTFAQDAQLFFVEWLTALETKQIRSDAPPCIRQHWSKYRSLMPSIALIFHVIEQRSLASAIPHAGGISRLAAERAAEWCEYLGSHAERLYGMVLKADTIAAIALSKKILDGKLQDGFTVRDIYKKNWSQLNDKHLAAAACEELVAANWIREERFGPKYQHKEVVTYRTNPKLLKKTQQKH